MKIHHETIKEFGHVVIHCGEAAVLGGGAALFVQNFSLWLILAAFIGGLILVFAGLYFVNKSLSEKQQHIEKQKIEEQKHDDT